MNLLDKAKEFLFSRRSSYLRTFSPNDRDSQAVLADLAKFCRANEPTFSPDERTHALLEGRREVWLRIQRHLNLSEDDLWEVYSRKG